MTQLIPEQLEFVGSEEFIRAIGLSMLPGLLGKVVSQAPEDAQVKGLLNEIPSETSAAERYALDHWFRYLWSGECDCLEIGPFLGGTSRAITTLFNALAQKAALRGDLQMLVSADLQLACALAVLGEVSATYRVVTHLKSRSYAQPMAKTINRALEVLNQKFVLDPEETHLAN